ncbi:MAG TPA: NnrS family protein, partial [Usitatibacteraceae bacterium]|nr:NnrS family protein [Usitatibacteraceae bacterium]
FFSSRVLTGYALYRPAFSIPFLGAACATHYLLESASLFEWTWVADAPMAAWVGWLAWKWGLTQSFRARLLAMLHVSLVMLAAALAFSAVASLAALAGHPGVFGRGPLHLLAVSYLAAMTFGMVSRVSLGHSGRALEADVVTWYGFLALVAVGVTRALADLAVLPAGARSALLGLAALAWIAIVAGWAARFVPIYLSPRSDGREG